MKYFIILVFIICAQAEAEGIVFNIESTIIGNQEQPRVLYIVPWQAPDDSAPIHREATTSSGMPLNTLDRDSFLRELAYRKELRAHHGP
jgi:hypothetical protein